VCSDTTADDTYHTSWETVPFPSAYLLNPFSISLAILLNSVHNITYVVYGAKIKYLEYTSKKNRMKASKKQKQKKKKEKKKKQKKKKKKKKEGKERKSKV